MPARYGSPTMFRTPCLELPPRHSAQPGVSVGVVRLGSNPELPWVLGFPACEPVTAKSLLPVRTRRWKPVPASERIQLEVLSAGAGGLGGAGNVTGIGIPLPETAFSRSLIIATSNYPPTGWEGPQLERVRPTYKSSVCGPK